MIIQFQIADGHDFLIAYNGGSEKGEIIEKLTGKVNKTISRLGNQMFLVFNKTDNSTGTRRFYIKIFESMYYFNLYIHFQGTSIHNYFLKFLAEKCQYWLNETAQTLTSPNYNFGIGKYDHNLECIWIINADIGSYITLYIHEFYVIMYLKN